MKKKTSIKTVLHRARISFLMLIFLFLLIFTVTIYVGVKSGEIEKKIVSPFKSWVNHLSQSLESKSNVVKIASPSGDLFSEFEKETPSPKTQNLPIQPPSQKACNRYTVTHLDGSTSNLCYNSFDYNQLSNLGNQLLNDRADLEFKQRVYEQSKSAYENWGGDLFKKSMEINAQKIQPVQDKVGQIVGQMQEIEKRGY